MDFEEMANPERLSGKEKVQMMRETMAPDPGWLVELNDFERKHDLWQLVRGISVRLVHYEIDCNNTAELEAAIDEVCRRWLRRDRLGAAP
jgi:hypothetical protein